MEAVRDLSMCISLEFILPYRFTSFLEVLEIFSWSSRQSKVWKHFEKIRIEESGIQEDEDPQDHALLCEDTVESDEEVDIDDDED